MAIYTKISRNDIISIDQKFNLGKANSATFNKFGMDKNLKTINDLPKDVIKNILSRKASFQ